MKYALIILAFIALTTRAHSQESFEGNSSGLLTKLDALIAAYPEYLSHHDGKILVWHDGTQMQISDGRTNKRFEDLLNSPDIDDMFTFEYPAGAEPNAPDLNEDPGRIRYEPLFVKMYGDCRKGEVAKKMRTVRWLPTHGGGNLQVTTVNGVAEALEKVSAELDKLPDRLVRFLIPAGGTYNCRVIAGTRRYSAHAFGAAIDINVKSAHYWLWTQPDAKNRYQWRNQIPLEIIDIFEKHGFIWGGRWYHFDTMHFEYRPEFFLIRQIE